jgi:hypothetical protein
LVKPGGAVDDSLRAVYIDIAKSPRFARDLEAYNKIAVIVRQKPAASIEEIVATLGNDVTFAKIGHVRSGLFPAGQHPGATQFWIQGNPLTSYGQRAGRHELTHLGAALRGQEENFFHEIAVQAATTPENLALMGGIIAVIGYEVYWVFFQ